MKSLLSFLLLTFIFLVTFFLIKKKRKKPLFLKDLFVLFPDFPKIF